VDVRIGVLHTMKEIEVELAPDVDRDEIKQRIETALSDDDAVLWLTDRHGKDVAIPSERVAYVEVGRADVERRIGFST
jgi:hypothetical protein